MGKYQPKVTIVTVVYNDVKHIEGTILSVTKQNYPNLEYIIIDGGSTDGTVDVIKKYTDKITYWVSEKDKGLYYAMNKGITVATGEWILFRNCGDYFSSLSDVSKVFNGNSYEGVDIIYGKCIYWDNDCYCVREPELIKSNPNVHKMVVFHPSSFVRTCLHKSMLFDTSYKVLADYNFFYKCLQEGKVFRYVPYILALFDTNEGYTTDNYNVVQAEKFRVWGCAEQKVKEKLKCRLHNNITNLKKYIRIHFAPKSVILRHRVMQGKTLWTEKFNYMDMIRQAINQEETFLT